MNHVMIDSILLDPWTLWRIGAFFNAFAAAILFALYRHHLSKTWLAWWSTGFLFQALGLMLLFVQGINLEELSTVLAITTSLSGYLLLWGGMQEYATGTPFLGRHPFIVILLIFLVGSCLIFFLPSWTRLSTASGIAALLGLTAIHALHNRKNSFATSFTKVTLGLNTGLALTQSFWGIDHPFPSSSIGLLDATGVWFLWLVIFPALALFGMLLMVSEDLVNGIRDHVNNLQATLKRTDAALASEQKVKEGNTFFMETLAVDYRTSLNTVREHLTTLRETPDMLTGTAARSIEAMTGASDRLDEIMESAQDKRRLIGKEIIACKEFLEIRKVLAGVVEGIPAASRKRITLSEGPLKAETMHADALLMKTLLLNLLENALKYSSPDTPVEMNCLVNGENLVVEVHDQGIGIPKQDLHMIFDKYSRGSNTEGRAGTGVGLHIAQVVADLHGGHVDIQSKKGMGTKASVILPLHEGMS